MSAVPPLSVVLPIFNGLEYIDQGVRSILDQSYGDFELVILDDGSTDGSGVKLRGWAERDSRIRLITVERRQGAAGSSNLVVSHARAPIVARMDIDDIAHPDRLKQQMSVLDSHRDAVLVGTLAETIDGSGRKVRDAYLAGLTGRPLFPPFPHSSIMFRRSAFDETGGYRLSAEKWEDVDLCFRLANLGRILVIPEPLMRYRQTGRSSRSVDGLDRIERAMDLMYRCMAEYRAGRPYDDLLGGEYAPAPGKTKIVPDAFLAYGSSGLWAGQRPSILRRLLKRGILKPDLRSISLLVWATWAEINPRGLRLVLSMWVKAKNLRARRRLGGSMLVEWRPCDARRHAPDKGFPEARSPRSDSNIPTATLL